MCLLNFLVNIQSRIFIQKSPLQLVGILNVHGMGRLALYFSKKSAGSHPAAGKL